MNGGSKAGATKLFAPSALLGLALLACGDDGGDGGSARAKCETLSRTWCDRVIACNEERGAFSSSTESDAYRDQCERNFEMPEQANCPAAVQVSATYDQCLEEIPSVACDRLLSTDLSMDPTPPACIKVVLTRE